ncbi:ammonium transporter [Mucilaginibacter sp.]|uniref:ammonium transporter n=1 Tax=Mucilaginibacter sp. TaxID=1882438 RepID=UPI002851E041|nr:ammonium transporter [Mucilaginibacter sp.]MDR3695861.1 ammonium transporter [Mucilaginibacter sp.]
MKVNVTKFNLLSSVRQLTREKWALGGTILAGKMIGLGLVVLAIFTLPGFFGTAAHAAVTAKADTTALEHSIINTAKGSMDSINTVWTLVAAFLVFAMQSGFTMLEIGFARKRETVNILMECIFDTCLCGILFYAIGYAFMFSYGNGFIGLHWFFLQGTTVGNPTDTYLTTGVPIIAHWIFQYAFADTCSTVVSGAMIGRTGFRGDILYSIGITGFIYPIIGHWAWGPDGWLALMGSKGNFFPALGQGFRDFAGSTVVHTIGGMASLAGAVVLGPRIGRVFARDGGGMPPGHNLPMAAVGGFILWFGWYGFNPGSTLSAMDAIGIGRVATNTTLAACAGGFTAMAAALWWGSTKGKFDLGFTVNGFLAGLVAITCPCYWVSPLGAVLLGGVAGFVVFGGVKLLEYLRIDDPIGAVPVHGFCGIWGTLSLGLFASGQFGATGPYGADNSAPVKGLFYGGDFSVLKAQAIGTFTIAIAVFVVTWVMMKLIMQLPHPWKLRVEAHGETGPGGLDMFDHGASAYDYEDGDVSLTGLFEKDGKVTA